MSRFAITARPLALFAVAGLTLAAGSPALARTKGPATITLTKKTAPEATSRLCMPKSTLGNKAEAAMPETICQSRTDWETAGVKFIIK